METTRVEVCSETRPEPMEEVYSAVAAAHCLAQNRPAHFLVTSQRVLCFRTQTHCLETKLAFFQNQPRKRTTKRTMAQERMRSTKTMTSLLQLFSRTRRRKRAPSRKCLRKRFKSSSKLLQATRRETLELEKCRFKKESSAARRCSRSFSRTTSAKYFTIAAFREPLASIAKSKRNHLKTS